MRTGYISKEAALKIAMIAVVPYIFSTEKFQEFCTGIEKLVRDYPEEPVNCKTMLVHFLKQRRASDGHV